MQQHMDLYITTVSQRLSWRLKSLAKQLFVQLSVYADITENTKVRITDPFVKWIQRWLVDFDTCDSQTKPGKHKLLRSI